MLRAGQKKRTDAMQNPLTGLVGPPPALMQRDCRETGGEPALLFAPPFPPFPRQESRVVPLSSVKESPPAGARSLPKPPYPSFSEERPGAVMQGTERLECDREGKKDKRLGMRPNDRTDRVPARLASVCEKDAFPS